MIEKNNIIFFDNDDEFYDFCVVPELVTVEEIGIDGKPFHYSDFNLSNLYHNAIAQGKKFAVRNENSKIARQKQLSYRTITKDLKNIIPYFDDIYDEEYFNEDAENNLSKDEILEGLKITKDIKVTEFKYHPKDISEFASCIVAETKEQEGKETIDLNTIDTKAVTNMKELFTKVPKEMTEKYNFNVSGWDMSKVTDTSAMFVNCRKFNCDISKWDVSKVLDMHDMFNGCKEFNQDLSNWNVSKCKDFSRAFYRCGKLNQDFSKWKASKIAFKKDVFFGCNALTAIPAWAK